MTSISLSNLESESKPKTAARFRSLSGLSRLLLLTAVVAGGIYYWRTSQRSAGIADEHGFIADVQTAKVRQSLMRITVNDDGNVESARNVELQCEVEGGSQILWIIDDGAEVETGAELVRLDSSVIEQEITQQTILYEKANSDLIAAEESLSVAEIAVKEYENGTFPKELQTAEANIVIARENLKNSENLLEHNQRMFRKGYINRLQLETSEFAVQRNKLDLNAQTIARDVLLEYTKPKMMKELISARESAAATVRAMKAAADLEKSKLDRLRAQLSKCVIRAPQPGLVVYAKPQSDRRSSEAQPIQAGAQVRQYQTIIQLPDLDYMQVKTLIHETKVDRVHVGMPATIRIRGQEMRGEVTQVKNQPESTNWFAPDVKEYAALVRVESHDPTLGLKPGMTAEVEIVIKEILDALQVPLNGVVQEGPEYVCYVKTGDSYERRPVLLGDANTSFLQITDGVSAGESVILNPRYCVAEAKRRASDMQKRSKQEQENRVREEQSAEPGAKKTPPDGGELRVERAKPAREEHTPKTKASPDAEKPASAGGDVN